MPFQLTTTSRRSFTVACGEPLGSWEWLHSIPCSKRHVHRATMYDVLRDTYLTCPLRMEILVADITSQILQCSEGHTLRQGIAGAKHTTPMGFSRQVACPPQRTSLHLHSHFLPSYPPVRHLLALGLMVLLGCRSLLICLGSSLYSGKMFAEVTNISPQSVL